MTRDELREAVDRLSEAAAADRDEARTAVAALLRALEEGTLRAAEPDRKSVV